MEDDPHNVQRRCRLCLHSEHTDLFGEIFDTTDPQLTRRTLRFLDLDKQDLSILPVCLSCVQTIQLFEAFGDLCRRSDGLFRKAEVLPWDQWEDYREHVTASVTLVQARRDDVERFVGGCEGSVVMGIKKEVEHHVYMEEFLDSVDIKEEKGTDSDDEKTTTDREDRQQTDLDEGEFFKKQLLVSQALAAQLDLLQPDDVSHHKIPWKSVRKQLGWKLQEIKQIWDSSKRWYDQKLEKGDLTDEGRPLYELVHSLLNRLNKPAKSGTKQREERKRKVGDERRLELDEKLLLANLFHRQELLWNTKHSDYQNQVKRSKALDQVASHFDISTASIRKEWRYLRDIYRSRRNRTGGPILYGDDPRDVQLYQLLDGMLRDNCLLGLKSGKAPAQQEGAPNVKRQRISADVGLSSADQRFGQLPDFGNAVNSEERKEKAVNERRLDLSEKLRLAELFYEQEHLWNTKHTDNHNQERRAETLDQVASHFDISTASIRKEWRYLRDLYRGRQNRAGGPVHESDDPRDMQLYQLLDAMLRDNCRLGLKSAQALVKRAGAARDWTYQIPADTPFRSEEQRLALAEEIGRYAIIWDATHPDCGHAGKRGEAWDSIAATFNCTKRILQFEWSRFVKRLDQASGSADPELFLQDPLHRRMHQLLTERGSTSVADEESPAIKLPRRRYTGKRSFDPEGCIKQIGRNGVARYFKVCELCGKEVERSLFEEHMNKHSGLTPYACSYEGCGKRYGSKTIRDRHEIMKHASESQLKMECYECGERFLHRSKFEYHFAVKHKSEEVPCNICGKLLKHKRLLQKHITKAHNSGMSSTSDW
uniref:Putative zinc finger protein zfp-36 n=1 Tax=Culex tarsalis TaxID=7177 RepID=A0A1Q3F5S1_CULTA